MTDGRNHLVNGIVGRAVPQMLVSTGVVFRGSKYDMTEFMREQ